MAKGYKSYNGQRYNGQNKRAAYSQGYRTYRRSYQTYKRRGMSGPNQPTIIIQKQRGELKGMDTDLSLTIGNVLSTTNTNGAAFCVNLIRTGNGSYNRVGNKIKAKSLRIVGNISCSHVEDDAAGFLGNILRMVVVWDQQPSGTLPTFDTIFGHTYQDATEETDYYDPLRYDNTGRFRVLKDCRYISNPQAGVTSTVETVLPTYYIDEYINLKVKESVYSSDSTPMTISDVSTGAIYVFFRAAANAVGGTQWVVNVNSRLRYED